MNELPVECKKNLCLAQLFLVDSNISETAWSFGGGTALRMYYNHRESNDIDIFLHDAQLLTWLSPRLNDFVEEHVTGYTEMSNFLKLNINEQEIDFIVAPFLTKNPFIQATINSRNIRCETPEEIVIKKIFYRSESFLARDILDFAVVILHSREQLIENKDIYCHKIPALRNRIQKIAPVFQDEIAKLKILDKTLQGIAIKTVLNFLDDIGAICQMAGKTSRGPRKNRKSLFHGSPGTCH